VSLRTFDPIASLDAPDILTFEGETEPTEFCLVNLLEAKIQPAMTVGAQWFLYRGGCWRETDKSGLGPIAQSLIPAKWRTARREHAVIDHLEGRLQKPREALASFSPMGWRRHIAQRGERDASRDSGFRRTSSASLGSSLHDADCHEL
jgi:hypothetical protein